MDDANTASSRSRASAPETADLSAEQLSELLLDWYDRHRRRLPWRAEPGVTADPYHVWLSEIMLQQTTVAAVKDYFLRFVSLWPSVHDLAAAPREDVLAEWAGLGYYARARNLHACAQVVSNELGGRFPEDEEALRTLPGIGAYTSAAISAIAFDRRATILDGNVERVIARMRLIDDPLPGSKPTLKALADEITPDARPGDYAQAIMDLGATICTPRSPKCMMCPWSDACLARAGNIAERYPVKTKKKPKPTRFGVAYFVVGGEGSLLLRRRGDKGLLGGMPELPSTPWDGEQPNPMQIREHAPLAAEWTPLTGIVRHTFTHFHLELSVMAARVEQADLDGHYWVGLDDLAKAGLPSVMAKVVKHAAANLA